MTLDPTVDAPSFVLFTLVLLSGASFLFTGLLVTALVLNAERSERRTKVMAATKKVFANHHATFARLAAHDTAALLAEPVRLAPRSPVFETCGCGRSDETVSTQPDPYVQDVEDEIVLLPLCDDCYRERCEDI